MGTDQYDKLYVTDEDKVSNDIECHVSSMHYQVPVPKNGTSRDLNLTPISINVIDIIGLVKSRKLLKNLFDPRSTATMIKKSIVPETAVPKTLSGDKTVKTIDGKMNANQIVHLRDVRLPEFDKNC